MTPLLTYRRLQQAADRAIPDPIVEGMRRIAPVMAALSGLAVAACVLYVLISLLSR